MAAAPRPRWSLPSPPRPGPRAAPDSGLVVALAADPGRRLLRASWPAIVLAAAGAAAAGFAQRLQPPAYAYLAAPGPVATLSAWAVVAVAVLLAYGRAAASGIGAAGPWVHLRARGGSLAITAGVLAAAILPCWWLALATGAAVAPLALALASVLRLPHPLVAGPTASAWAWAGALLSAAAASAGGAAAALRPPVHHRLRVAPLGTWAGQLPLDLALIAAGWWVSRHAGLGVQTSGPAALFGGASGGSAAPLPLWAAGAAGALFLTGSAMLAGRLLSWGFRLVDRLAGRTMAPVGLIAVRAAARAASPLRLALLPALAAGAAAYVICGTAGALATDAHLRALRIGSDLRIDEAWPSPCDRCQLPRGVIADPWTFPVGLPGATSATAMILGDDGVRTARGFVPATVAGVDPPALLQTADWSGVPAGPDLDRLLGRDPSAVVISTALAQQTGLGPNERLVTNLLPNQYVAAVVDGWPGMGSGSQPWAIVSWDALGPALRERDAYNAFGLQVRILARGGSGVASSAMREALLVHAAQDVYTRLVPGADPAQIAAAVADNGVEALMEQAVGPKVAPNLYADYASTMPEIALPMRRVPAGTAAASTAATLLPLGAVAVVAGVLGGAAAPADASGFPAGDALAGLSADGETRRARRRLHVVTVWSGLAWGTAAGTVAAALFWPILRESPGGPYAIPFHSVWAGLPVAAALLVAGGATWTWGAVHEPWAPDPLVQERMAAATRRVPAAAIADEPARRRTRTGLEPAARPLRMAAALLALAARRLIAAAPRLPGLAAGILVAAVVAATVPIFTTGAMTRVLRLEGPTRVNERPPGAVLVSLFPPPGASVTPALLDRLQAIAAGAGRAAGLPATPPVTYLATPIEPVTSGASATSVGFLEVDALPDLAAHAVFEQGVPPAARPEADGTIDAAATDSTMANGTWRPYQLGHVYALQLPSGPPVRVRITGVFAEAHRGVGYWPYNYFDHDLFVDPAVLQDLIFQRHAVPLDQAAWYSVTDLPRLNADQVPGAMSGLAALERRVTDAAPGARLDASPYPVLAAFTNRERTLATLLRMASVPVLALALYFIVLTAGVAVGAEAGEIAVHVSRGAPAPLLIVLYLAEWVLLAVPLTAAAPLLGGVVARTMGGAAGFLRFTSRSPLPIFLEGKDLAYAAAAAGAGVAAALVPVVAAVGRSIVEARGRTSRSVTAPFWQRAYLDLGVLVVLAALWAAFRRAGPQGGGISAIAGDPGLYLLPGAFIAAAGLVGVRGLGWALRVMDARAGSRLPVGVSLSLRQIGRVPAQVAPVMLLLCLATALGTYSAAAARTLQANLAAAVHYRVGADLRLQQNSPCTGTLQPPPVCVADGLGGQPPRPLPPFAPNHSAPGVADAAEMIEAQALLTASGRSQAATLLLVDPAAYARVAWWPLRLDAQPEAALLSLLRSRPDAMLVSPSVSGSLAGNVYTVSLDGTPAGRLTKVGTVSLWPGADTQGPLAIASLATAPELLGFACDGTHYCPGDRIVLMRLKPGADVSKIEDSLSAAALGTEQADDARAEVADALATPEWAGQNGMFSVGFVVAAAVAATGYLLYALLMLRGQVGQMGLLRAVGMDRRTLIGGVALQQAILVLSGAVVGVLAGLLASSLFVPLYQPAFTGPDSPPFEALGPGSAVWKLAALLVFLFAAVIGVLLWLLVRLRVGESVKLED